MGGACSLYRSIASYSSSRIEFELEMVADTIKEQLPEFFIEGQLTDVVLGKGSNGYVKKVTSGLKSRSNLHQ